MQGVSNGQEKTAHWQVNGGNGIKEPVKDTNIFDPDAGFMIWDQQPDVYESFKELAAIAATRQNDTIKRAMIKHLILIHYSKFQDLQDIALLRADIAKLRNENAKFRDVVQNYAYASGISPELMIAHSRVVAIGEKAVNDVNAKIGKESGNE